MKNVPQRMCIACRQMKDKRDLIRIVKNGDEINVDRTFKAVGRGAYVCNNPECIAKLIRHKLLNKAFKCAVDDKTYSEIEEAVVER